MSGKAIRNTKPVRDSKKTLKLSVIIPSASEGIRMKSVGPRSLIPIGNQSLIEYQANNIRDVFPNSEIILVSGFDSTRLMNKAPKGIICVENERYTETNVLRSVAIGLRASVQEAVLIVYGDLVFNVNTLDFPIDYSCVVYNNTYTADESEVGCTVTGNKLENIFYGLTNRWTSIVFITGKELDMFKAIAFDKQKEKLYTWEAINQVIENGGEFNAYCPRGQKSFDIDSTKDLDKIGAGL